MLVLPSLGLNFLSFAHFSQTFNHICVDLAVFLFFAFSFSWTTSISSDEANRLSANFAFCVSRFPCSFHSNFCIALYNLHLHSIIHLCPHYCPVKHFKFVEYIIIAANRAFMFLTREFLTNPVSHIDVLYFLGKSSPRRKPVKLTCLAQTCWYGLSRSGLMSSLRRWLVSQFACVSRPTLSRTCLTALAVSISSFLLLTFNKWLSVNSASGAIGFKIVCRIFAS